MTKREALKTYFGHSDFRDGQEKIIDCILGGGDALCVMPTGAGKSVCYQIPAMLSDGITLVVSPLISLMKDQVRSLKEMGIGAAYLNSSLTFPQYIEALRRAKRGMYKIIYVAPERLMTDGFLDFARSSKLSLIAVDEAHCVSQWGQDFRPSYSHIPEFVSALPTRPVVAAFTATATAAVKRDIAKLLALENPLSITTGFDRQNLHFAVQRPKSKDAALLDILQSSPDRSAIVYCATRKAVESVCSMLCTMGYSATRYHAGLDSDERRQNQEDFVCDAKQIMVATNAFGMGIDKSNVSLVIHYNMPKNLESYYQEAGRAGRDGENARCVLLYSGADVQTNLFLIDHSEENPELDDETVQQLRQRERERLKTMTYYCTTSDCLRGFILKYFGETPVSFCSNCSNCSGDFDIIDVTSDAKKILACISQLNGRFGAKMITDILRGSKNERILRFHLDEHPCHGTMADTDERRVRAMIDLLLSKKIIDASSGEYPTVSLSNAAREVLGGGQQIFMKIPRQVAVSVKVGRETDDSAPVSMQLLQRLKALRSSIARKKSVPAYVIFTDASLRDMCRKTPRNKHEFLEVSGVGEAKLRQYGEAFLKCINEFVNE